MVQKKVLRLEGPQEAAPAPPAPESVTASKDPFAKPSAAENGNREDGNGEFNLKVSFSSCGPLSYREENSISASGMQDPPPINMHTSLSICFLAYVCRPESEGWKHVRILTAIFRGKAQTLL